MIRGLVALVLMLAAGGAGAAGLKSGAFNPARAAPDFSLRGSDGSELKLSRYRGKVVAVSFGYTFCPDVCPTTLADLAQARRRLGSAAGDFQVIYVTVDPRRDTAEHLRRYLAAFDPSFIGATGSAAQLARMREAYGIQIAKQPAAPGATAYTVHHSSLVYLIDRDGKLRAAKPFGAPIDDLVHDVNVLLEE